MLNDFFARLAVDKIHLQDPRFLLNSVYPGYHSTKLLYIPHKLTRRYRNSAEIGGLAEPRSLQSLDGVLLHPTYRDNIDQMGVLDSIGGEFDVRVKGKDV